MMHSSKMRSRLFLLGADFYFYIVLSHNIYYGTFMERELFYGNGTLGNNSIITMDILHKSRESLAIMVGTFYLKKTYKKD